MSNANTNILEARLKRLEGKSEDRFGYVPNSPQMAKVNEALLQLRRDSMRGVGADAPVLFIGEPGCAIEGMARAVHMASQRARGPWVAVNIGAMSAQQIDTEIFGAETGAVKIAEAGTLYVDGIQKADAVFQAKLAKVIREGKVRVIGACRGGDLSPGELSQLFTAKIQYPALRSRGDDAVAVARDYARKVFEANGKKFEGFSADAEDAIRHYPWPGNEHEVYSVLERASLTHQRGPVTGAMMMLAGASGGGGASAGSVGGTAAPQAAANGGGGSHLRVVDPASMTQAPGGYMELKKRWVDSFEREYLAATLNRHKGNVSAAAREAKLDRSNFLRLLRRHGIKSQEFRSQPSTGGSGQQPAMAVVPPPSRSEAA